SPPAVFSRSVLSTLLFRPFAPPPPTPLHSPGRSLSGERVFPSGAPRAFRPCCSRARPGLGGWVSSPPAGAGAGGARSSSEAAPGAPPGVRRFCGSWSLVLSAAAVAMGLLKGLDPLLTADLLYVLRAMGHGDELVVCDCNFPATTTAEATTTKKLVSLPGADCPQAIDAICSVLPLDFFVPDPAHFMSPQEGVELPPAGKKVHATVQAALDKHCGVKMQPLDRFAFYERAKKAFAVVQTMERRPYGCYILKKGVVGPDGNDLKP
ncbi:unnamed protein product, partial [Prorocentrum cordatum]